MDKLDYTFKKVNNKLFTQSGKHIGNEVAKAGVILHNQNVMLENIPSIPTQNGHIKKYSNIELRKLTFLPSHLNCLAIVEDGDYVSNFIPEMYGLGYTALLSVSISGSAQFVGQYFTVSASNKMGWNFDYETGLFTFDEPVDFKTLSPFDDFNLDDPDEAMAFEELYELNLSDVKIGKYFISAYRYIGKNMNEQITYNDSLGELHIQPTKSSV